MTIPPTLFLFNTVSGWIMLRLHTFGSKTDLKRR